MPYRDTYHRTLLEARRLYLSELLPDALEAMYLEIGDLLRRIVDDMQAGTITETRARELSRSIRRHLSRLELRLAAVGDGSMQEAVDLAVAGHAEATNATARITGVQVGYSFASVPTDVLEQMMVRRGLSGAETFQTLIRRHVTRLAGDVDRYLFSSAARGIAADRGAVVLAKIIAGDDPELLAALRNVRTFRGVSRILRRDAPDAATFQRGQRLLKDAYRIQVTEMNTAYFEADRLASEQSPVVDLVRWELSGRHPVNDICDIYAEADMQGFGAGLWHPASVPPLPHPHCMCSLSHVLRKPADWDKPKRDVIEPKTLSETDVRRVLGSGKGITKRYVERQTEQANRLAKMAYESTQTTTEA